MSLTIGVDVGGTKILAGVVDSQGVVVAKVLKPTPPQGGSELTKAIADAAKELMRDFSVESVGISAAGFVSSDRKRMLASPNIAHWNGVDLERELNVLIGRPVVIENDGNAAAWGEARFGAGRGAGHLMLLTIGTGIGGGIVLDQNLYRGAFGVAAEFGHLRVVPEGRLCGCGARGCFEQYGSGKALLAHAKEIIIAGSISGEAILARGDGTLAGLNGEHLTEAAREGDEVALAAFDEIARWLGAGIASLCVLLDPERVIIGGGVIEAADILLTRVRKAVENEMPFFGAHPMAEIVAAQLGNSAGLIGAADLARN